MHAENRKWLHAGNRKWLHAGNRKWLHAANRKWLHAANRKVWIIAIEMTTVEMTRSPRGNGKDVSVARIGERLSPIRAIRGAGRRRGMLRLRPEKNVIKRPLGGVSKGVYSRYTEARPGLNRRLSMREEHPDREVFPKFWGVWDAFTGVQRRL